MDLITTQDRDFSGMPSTTRLRFAQHGRGRRVNFYIIVKVFVILNVVDASLKIREIKDASLRSA